MLLYFSFYDQYHGKSLIKHTECKICFGKFSPFLINFYPLKKQIKSNKFNCKKYVKTI